MRGGPNLRVIGDYRDNTTWSISASGGRKFGAAAEAGFDEFNLKTLDVTVGLGMGQGATIGRTISNSPGSFETPLFDR